MNLVKQALIAEGWTIADDPLYLDLASTTPVIRCDLPKQPQRAQIGLVSFMIYLSLTKGCT